MAVSARQQLRFRGIAFAIPMLVPWLLGGTLLPFPLGAAVARFRDPLADRLRRRGIGRVVATRLVAVTGRMPPTAGP